MSAMFNSVLLATNYELDRRAFLSVNPNHDPIPPHPATFANTDSIAHLQPAAESATANPTQGQNETDPVPLDLHDQEF